MRLQHFPFAVTIFALLVSLALAWAGSLVAFVVMPVAGVVLAVRGIALNWPAYARVPEEKRAAVSPAVRSAGPVRSAVRVTVTPYRVVEPA